MDKLSVEKIISGGQTGVDRAALDFAIDSAISHGGACPKGRFAEDGVLLDKYHLYEVGNNEDDLSTNYAMRTVENIMQADGTLIVVPIYPMPIGWSDGTVMTINKAKELNKPYFIFQIAHSDIDSIRDWLRINNVKMLNIAGPRESNFPGIYQNTFSLLKQIFQVT